MTLLTSAAGFTAATVAMAAVVEDFKRDATGAAVPSDYFSLTYGDHYYRSSLISFQSVGVQPTHNPGVTDDIIVGSYGSIMSEADGEARDGLIATFSAPQDAVALVLNDDEGSQVSTLTVTTSEQTFTFTVPTATATFAGVVRQCGSRISAVRVAPPVPSHWWRLFSVTAAAMPQF